MSRSKYTPEQQHEALDLFAKVGAAEAARRTGIKAGTIASWATRAGVAGEASQQLRTAVEVKQLTIAQRRQALGEKFLEKAEKLIDCVHVAEPAMDRKRGIEAARAAAEAAQLLTGQPTSRVDAMMGTDQERALAVVRQLHERREAS